MKKLTLTLLLCTSSFLLLSQVDSVGSGRAFRFDGVDDFINLGDVYDDLQFPFSVSAWIYFDNSDTGGPVLISQDNAPLYNGFWFYVTPSAFYLEYGDGRGENQPAYRKGKSTPRPVDRGHWNHYCAVVRGLGDISLYFNGIDAGGASTGESSLPMASNYPSDHAKIGFFISNGITYRFKGTLDEIRVYNTALSRESVRQEMCKKLPKNHPGLIGRWTFDETSGNVAHDKSKSGYHGQILNSPTSVYSGAPIGDNSIYQYQTNWTGGQIVQTEGTETLKVLNVSGNPDGIHIYTVKSPPSQTTGLNATPVPDRYFGVFSAATDVNNSFDVVHAVNGEDSNCRAVRKDNSISTWTNPASLTSISQRIELIKQSNPTDFGVNLGIDESLCPFVPRTLQPLNNTSGYTFLWQNGSTQPMLPATTYGTYWVSVTKNCLTHTDTVIFTQSPKQDFGFTLGMDETVCPLTPRILKPLNIPTGFDFTWQNGSHQPSLAVTGYGTYWVTIEGECLHGKDTVTFAKATLTELQVDLGDDEVVCPLAPKTLTPLSNPNGFAFTWQDGSTEPTYHLTKYGKYWVTIENECAMGSDTIDISQKRDFEEFEIPNVITPNQDEQNGRFIVHRDLQGFHLKVYNRWGIEVFESKNYQNDWDGDDLPSGVYYYYLNHECVGAKKGTISILD